MTDTLTTDRLAVRSRFYRWWPTVATFIGGWALAAATGSLVGSQIQNHDAAVLMAFFVSMFVGIPAGLVSLMVWYRRNTW